jgi:hypothetical protein
MPDLPSDTPDPRRTALRFGYFVKLRWISRPESTSTMTRQHDQELAVTRSPSTTAVTHES